MRYVHIEGKDGLVRDIESRAVLNTNKAEYENYLANKAKRQREKLLQEHQQEEINQIKDELAEIKQLLVTLIRKENG